jgi:hypothetical protein
MIDALLPFVVIILSVGIGYVLYLRFSKHVTIFGATLRAFVAVLWVLVAVVTIIQGFLIFGAAILIAFSAIAFTNGSRVVDAAKDSDSGSTRRRVSNLLKPGE